MAKPPDDDYYAKLNDVQFAAMMEDDAAYAKYMAYKEGKAKPNGPNGHAEKTYIGPAVIDFAGSLHIPIQPRTWLDSHKLLRKNTAFQLNGDGGIGKTEISLQMMIGMCATGLMFNLPIERGACLFVSFEEPENEIRWRIDHLCHAFNIPSNSVANLNILDLTGERDPWMFKEKDRQLVCTDRWTWLQKQFEQLKPMFIGMDNKTRFFGANQNDAVLSTTYAHHIELACRDFDTTIMPLAHVSLSQLSSGRGDSGSVAAGNAFRSRMLFSHADPDREAAEEDDGTRKLTVMKANATPTGHFLDFQWDKGLEYFRCLYRPPRADERLGTIDKHEAVFIKLMHLHDREKIKVSNKPRSPNYAPDLFVARPEREGCHWKGFKAAMQNLIQKGMIEVTEYGPKSRAIQYLKIVRT